MPAKGMQDVGSCSAAQAGARYAPPKCISGNAAFDRVERELRQLGFRRLNCSRNSYSRYYRFRDGCPFRLRLSDHPHDHLRCDVVHQEIAIFVCGQDEARRVAERAAKGFHAAIAARRRAATLVKE